MMSSGLISRARRCCLPLLLVTLLVAGCSVIPPSNVRSNARLTPSSNITRDLMQLPPPKTKIAVAVYGFRDQTGQFKPSPDSSYSTSVTQGAASMLVKALKDSGWYVPVEREGLQNLLTERKIVRAIESPADKGKALINLPNLMPASMIIEGGVIAYESNVRTGGKGASYLGIGTSTQYHVDQVTVILRAIDIRDGQVLDAVSVTKTIYSYQFSASLYKFTSYQRLLQGETGYTTNEPAQLAVREAIESAVIHMTVQGVRDRFFELRDEEDLYSPVVQAYLAESLSNVSEDANADEPVIQRRSLMADDLVAPVQPLLPVSPAKAAAKTRAPAAQRAPVSNVSAAPASAPAPLPPAQGVQPKSATATATATTQGAPVTKIDNIEAPARETVAPASTSPAGPAGLAESIFLQYWRR
ncbi:CsgG/HfaB family protein [Actimicrobium sp. CCI2.3]|uniref:CsgG/HfaB family protein n=1 Tax=Actimicrobium sp. CCI2.3 TaxID=3048616 RepID=UPI002AB59024|nr:CsgG/HfaB family protein [Actimicrobium sp. CCI2.3]MDY7574739.1 CsgG/HfaB family protein [Actimicrobium sp. CCI2.3]MEB0020300.1 CsgG/HfaB family protein [Actimicrobium sp. CCI2.3]